MENEAEIKDLFISRSVKGEDELEELIKNLEEQCKINEKSGNFLEADKVHQRVLDLKNQVQKRRQQTLSTRQQHETLDIESAFQQELTFHNTQWHEKLSLFKQSCHDAEDQLLQKQQSELESTKQSLLDSLPILPKHSPELLNLKRIQDTLVRNKQYKEAHHVQQQMIDLEEKLKHTWGLDRESKVQLSLVALSKRQENEISSFKQKVLTGAEELKKMRVEEYENIVKKFQNFKKEMVMTHKLEINRFGGKHTTGCGTSRLDLNQSSRLIFSRNLASRPSTAAEHRTLIPSSSEKNFSSPNAQL